MQTMFTSIMATCLTATLFAAVPCDAAPQYHPAPQYHQWSTRSWSAPHLNNYQWNNQRWNIRSWNIQRWNNHS